MFLISISMQRIIFSFSTTNVISISIYQRKANFFTLLGQWTLHRFFDVSYLCLYLLYLYLFIYLSIYIKNAEFVSNTSSHGLSSREMMFEILHITNLYNRQHNVKFYPRKPGADAGGCHCCQCITPKWLTLIH